MHIFWPIQNPRSVKSFDVLSHRHYRTSEDRERELDRCQTGNEFSPWRDAFHVPFPSDLEGYASSTCSRKTQDSTVNPILSLPVEVSDLIFSLLPVPALDAARYTCRAWWYKITSNKRILASVLHGSTNNHQSLCDRLRSFEHEAYGLCPTSALYPAYQPGASRPRFRDASKYGDTWRTRFRAKTSHFFTSSTLRGARIRLGSFKPILTKMAERSSYVFIVVEASYDFNGGIGDRRSNVLFLYRFDSTDRPLYIGFVDAKGIVGPFDVHVTETRPHKAWTLHVVSRQKGMPDVQLYSITTKQSFSSYESPFVVKPLVTCGDVHTTVALDSSVPAQSSPINSTKGKEKWKILAPFSSEKVVSMRSLVM